MNLLEVLKPEHIVAPLEANTLREAISSLVGRMVESGAIADPQPLEQLITRERIRDVVRVGDRVLLPHMRTSAVTDVVAALGVAPHPIDLEDHDESSTASVVVLVLAPPEAVNRYLQLVAALARALRNDTIAERITSAQSPQEILQIEGLRELKVPPSLTVRDLMTPRVYRVFPDTPVREVLELMRRHNLHAVPVVGEKREVLGVVSERDILRHLMPAFNRPDDSDSDAAVEQAALRDTPVRDIMQRSVMCISEDQGLSEIASIMINKDVERMPVVNEGQLTGFITRSDLMRKLFGE